MPIRGYALQDGSWTAAAPSDVFDQNGALQPIYHHREPYRQGSVAANARSYVTSLVAFALHYDVIPV